MALSVELRERLAEALAKQHRATKADLLETYPMEVTMGPDRMVYCNPRVTSEVDSLSPSEVTHVVFTPMKKEGLVAIEACEETTRGAVQFVRGDSRRTGSFNMRVALVGFSLDFSERRKLKFAVEKETVLVEGRDQSVLVIRIKTPAAKKRVLRPRKKKGDAAKPGGDSGQNSDTK